VRRDFQTQQPTTAIAHSSWLVNPRRHAPLHQPRNNTLAEIKSMRGFEPVVQCLKDGIAKINSLLYDHAKLTVAATVASSTGKHA
jgi:hypothetical protein